MNVLSFFGLLFIGSVMLGGVMIVIDMIIWGKHWLPMETYEESDLLVDRIKNDQSAQ